MVIAVIVVLALVCALLIVAVIAKTREDAAAAARAAAAATLPPLDGPSTTPSSPRASGAPSPGAAAIGPVALIGDGSVDSAGSGVSAGRTWPALLRSALGVSVTDGSSAGAGYTAAGADGGTFVDIASEISTRAKTVLFVGGAADARADPLRLATAATNAYSVVSQRAPGARIVVVGPLVADGATEAQLGSVRAVLRQSARIAGARYVGLSGLVDSGATTSDRLTAQDQRAIADRLAALLADDAG